MRVELAMQFCMSINGAQLVTKVKDTSHPIFQTYVVPSLEDDRKLTDTSPATPRTSADVNQHSSSVSTSERNGFVVEPATHDSNLDRATDEIHNPTDVACSTPTSEYERQVSSFQGGASPADDCLLGHSIFLADLLSAKLLRRLHDSQAQQFNALKLEIEGGSCIDVPMGDGSVENGGKLCKYLFVVSCGRNLKTLDPYSDTTGAFAHNKCGKEVVNTSGLVVTLPFEGFHFACIQMFLRPVADLHAPSVLRCDLPVGVALINLQDAVTGNEVTKLYRIRRQYPSTVVVGYLRVSVQLTQDPSLPSLPLKQVHKHHFRFHGLISPAHPEHPGYNPSAQPIRAPPAHGLLSDGYWDTPLPIALPWADTAYENASATSTLPFYTITAPDASVDAALEIVFPPIPHIDGGRGNRDGDEDTAIIADLFVPEKAAMKNGYTTVVPLAERAPDGRKIRSLPYFLKYTVVN